MKIAEIVKKAVKSLKIKQNLPDLFMLVGFIAALYGIHCIYPPAMWIVGGSALIFIGYPRKGAE